MKNLMLVVFFVFGISMVSEAQVVSTQVRVEKVHAFTGKELWNSARSITVSAGETSIVYRSLDHETIANKSGWYPCALLMVGTGDLAVTPLSLRMWTKSRCLLKIVPASDSSLAPNESKYFIKLGDDEPLSVTIDAHMAVRIGTTRVGKIVQPR